MPNRSWLVPDSAPRGWYLITPAVHFRVGDYVVAQIPNEAALLAAARGYLPLTVLLLKQVGAVAGVRVCTCDGVVYVDSVATTLQRLGTIVGGDRFEVIESVAHEVVRGTLHQLWHLR